MTFLDSAMLLGVGVLALDFLSWRFLRFGGRKGHTFVRIPLFALLSYVLWTHGMVPFAEAPWKDDPFRHFVAQALELTWWLQFAQIATALMSAYILPQGLREKLFRDVVRALTFMGALVAGLGFVINMPIGGLLATSGAVAIVIGLAVQSTLADVFSGVVLSATEPYGIGDSVTIGDIQGEVIESNWRATTLLNGDGNTVIVPNSSAAKSNIINQSRPEKTHGVDVPVQVTTHARPATVIAALTDAVTSTRGILANPAPTVGAIGLRGKHIDYRVVVYVDAMNAKLKVRNQLIDQIHRHFLANGIPLSSGQPVHDLSRDAVSLLREIEMFRSLSDAELGQLAGAMSRKQFEPGQMIYEVGVQCPDERRALYIVTSGVAGLLAEHAGRYVEIARLSPGDAVGRAGVLTGESVPIKLRAIGHVSVAWVPKTALTPILQANPAAGQDMLDGLVAFQAIAAEAFKDLPVHADSHADIFHRLLAGMRRLHGLSQKH
ncbi:small-conductance mechanosensitive channel/CRP-like cAMP-binding protein [Luteibacter sp. HA06]